MRSLSTLKTPGAELAWMPAMASSIECRRSCGAWGDIATVWVAQTRGRPLTQETLPSPVAANGSYAASLISPVCLTAQMMRMIGITQLKMVLPRRVSIAPHPRLFNRPTLRRLGAFVQRKDCPAAQRHQANYEHEHKQKLRHERRANDDDDDARVPRIAVLDRLWLCESKLPRVAELGLSIFDPKREVHAGEPDLGNVWIRSRGPRYAPQIIASTSQNLVDGISYHDL